LLNGTYKSTCDDTTVETGSFINGKKDGLWKNFSAKGKLIKEVNYSNGKLDGKIIQYYLNGNTKLSGEFLQSKRVGTSFDKKGKKAVFQYDYSNQKTLLTKNLPAHKDGDLKQSEYTEEWYILRSPEKEYKSKTQPLGGYAFANYILTNIIDVPIDIWDTFLYGKYSINNKISNTSEVVFDMNVKTNNDANKIDYVFLIVTNPPEKIKKVEYSSLQLELLDMKIHEALNCMPP